jgi:LuxR family maltose regulon positive regulatory protein
MLSELRSRDLMFTESETAAFLEQAGHAVEGSVLGSVHDTLEGWPVGLRLTTAALQHHSETDAFFRRFRSEAQGLRDYLMESVLSHQSPALRDALRTVSILERFCAPLCETLLAAEGDADREGMSGPVFLRELHKTGLPVATLDDAGQWYRYHCLVKDLLGHELESRLAPDEIAGLHDRAQGWLEAEGLLEEAMTHAEKRGGAAEVGRLIVRHRSEILNEEQFHRLDLWLRRLSNDVIEEDLELLMLRAWQLQNRGRYDEAYSALDRIDEFLNSEPPDSRVSDYVRGGVDALRAGQRFYEGRPDLGIEYAKSALARLPPDALSERGYAVWTWAGALQAVGDFPMARQVVYEALADAPRPGGTLRARLLSTLCFINWMAADLTALKQSAAGYRDLSNELELPETYTLARYFEALGQYEQNDLPAAEATLRPTVEGRQIANEEIFLQAAFVLASVYQAQGRADMARDLAESLSKRELGRGNVIQLERARAFEAELALRQGRSAAALLWARRSQPKDFVAMFRFREPPLTLARALIAASDPESRAQAERLLAEIGGFVSSTHNRRFLIEALSLKALLSDGQGDDVAANDALRRAVALAQPGGFIRVFLDLGPELAGLLNRVEADEEGLRYIGRILAAFRAEQRPKAAGAQRVQAEAPADRHPSGSPLTKRELEILGLLAKRLSNKEIARKLFISPGTVKRHSSTIYSKLGVHDRRKAVAKAVGLGILAGLPRS